MTEDGRHVGERLRSIRRQKGLSLHDVEARSGHEFKASVLGAYERGERAISVPRLIRDAEVDIDLTERDSAPFEEGFTLDLQRLNAIEDADAAVLSRYAATIQLQRQDFNGRILTIRRDDLRVVAAVLGRSPEELKLRLEQLGLRATSASA